MQAWQCYKFIYMTFFLPKGHALAGGCVLGLACDYRIMADGPRIGLVETEAVSEMKIDGVL